MVFSNNISAKASGGERKGKGERERDRESFILVVLLYSVHLC